MLSALIVRTVLAALPAGQAGVEISVHLKDGRVLIEKHSGVPRHNPRQQGSSDEDVIAKFRQQVAFSAS